jgi:hypothetical protein
VCEWARVFVQLEKAPFYIRETWYSRDKSRDISSTTDWFIVFDYFINSTVIKLLFCRDFNGIASYFNTVSQKNLLFKKQAAGNADIF